MITTEDGIITVTVSEAAELAGVKQNVIRQAINRGKLAVAYRQPFGKTVRNHIALADLRAWINDPDRKRGRPRKTGAR